MQKQSIADRLVKAGVDNENAKELASEIVDNAYRKETQDEFIRLVEQENSPLTYPNGDKEAAAKAFGVQVKELADPAKRAQADKQMWDIYDDVKADALKAGLPFSYGTNAVSSAYDFYKGDLMKTALILGGWSRKRAESAAE